MSEKLGPIAFGDTQEMIFLGREIATGKNYSEKIAAEIDNEVKEIVDKAFQAAKKILISRKKALKALAEKLIKEETIEKDEFDNLIKNFGFKMVNI